MGWSGITSVIQCSYGGQAGTVYFATLSVEEL